MAHWVLIAAVLAGFGCLSCGGKALGTAPEASGGSNQGGAATGAVSDQHLLLAKAGPRASSPDAAWGADRLGVIYLLDSRDGQKGLGLSISRSESLERDGFEQSVLAEPSARRSPHIASVADGFALLWLQGSRPPEALMYLAVDGTGRPEGEAQELAQSDNMLFSLASSRRTLAVAATERVANDWAVTLRLVTDSAIASSLVLDTCAQQPSAPAVVWDGRAFDVVYVCAEPLQPASRLKLMRVTEAGQVLGNPRVLETEAVSGPCASLGASFDRGALSLVYARQAQSSATFLARVDPEFETPFEPSSLEGSLPPGRLSVAPTPTGYQVLSTDCTPGPSVSVSVTLCALDAAGVPSAAGCRRMPTSSSVPRPTALVARAEGALLVYDEFLLLSHSGVFVVELPNDLRDGFSATSAVWPVGELSPGSLACSADACRLQSFRSQGRFRSRPARALEYDELGEVEVLDVDLSSERVETHVDSARLLPVRIADVVQSGTTGSLALLDAHAFDDPPVGAELVALDGNLSQLWSLPIHPGDLPPGAARRRRVVALCQPARGSWLAALHRRHGLRADL